MSPPPQPPQTLPIFPLTGSLLLPGNYLPLNIFEPRYRHMVADVLKGGLHIGMVQPVVPRQDNGSRPEMVDDHPEVYRIGCAGYVEQSEKQPDGRYLILLKGVRRFRAADELPLHRGYRRIIADYDAFPEDETEPLSEIGAQPLLAALESFGVRHGMSFEMERLELMPGVLLMNGLAAALPFSPAEKQALLECPTVEDRRDMLLTLMDFGLEDFDDGDVASAPTVH